MLWETNAKNWNLSLSKADKLWTGSYIILKDYAGGVFPPRFEDQAKAYEREIEYHTSLPGAPLEEVQKFNAIKPFWTAACCGQYLREFSRLYLLLEEAGVRPGQRLLELGCGSGWMAEFLALAGYSVLGTTISHHDVVLGKQKIEALKCKQFEGDLEFIGWPMESVHKMPKVLATFDAAFVYEALHHAFDWREAIRSTAQTLKPGGWFLIANEPNRLHTFISYRVAKLSSTHEIGLSKTELVRELKASGFAKVKVIQPRFDNRISRLWILARRT